MVCSDQTQIPRVGDYLAKIIPPTTVQVSSEIRLRHSVIHRQTHLAVQIRIIQAVDYSDKIIHRLVGVVDCLATIHRQVHREVFLEIRTQVALERLIIRPVVVGCLVIPIIKLTIPEG